MDHQARTIAVPEQLRLVTDDSPVLHEEAEPVVMGTDCTELAVAMTAFMLENNGMGLAAPQIGLGLQVIVGLHPQGNWQFSFVNPKIVKVSEQTCKMDEGCLSYPGDSVIVERPKIVTIEAFDLKWNPVKFKARDLLGRVLQHEIDHIMGVTMHDRAGVQ